MRDQSQQDTKNQEDILLNQIKNFEKGTRHHNVIRCTLTGVNFLFQPSPIHMPYSITQGVQGMLLQHAYIGFHACSVKKLIL